MVVRNKKVVLVEGRTGTQKLLEDSRNEVFKRKGVLVKFPKKKTRFKNRSTYYWT